MGVRYGSSYCGWYTPTFHLLLVAAERFWRSCEQRRKAKKGRHFTDSPLLWQNPESATGDIQLGVDLQHTRGRVHFFWAPSDNCFQEAPFNTSAAWLADRVTDINRLIGMRSVDSKHGRNETTVSDRRFQWNLLPPTYFSPLLDNNRRTTFNRKELVKSDTLERAICQWLSQLLSC